MDRQCCHTLSYLLENLSDRHDHPGCVVCQMTFSARNIIQYPKCYRDSVIKQLLLCATERAPEGLNRSIRPGAEASPASRYLVRLEPVKGQTRTSLLVADSQVFGSNHLLLSTGDRGCGGSSVQPDLLGRCVLLQVHDHIQFNAGYRSLPNDPEATKRCFMRSFVR